MLLHLALCAALTLAATGTARAAGPVRETDSIRSDDGRRPSAPVQRRDLMLSGDPARPVELDVLLITPPGRGPFPLVIWNHGSAEAADRRRARGETDLVATYYFLSRGYAVATPQMRGYGRSGGKAVGAGCTAGALAAHGAGNAADILAVLDGLARDPALDTRRVVVAGASFGGLNALATGARGDPRVGAVVDFHGGLKMAGCRDGDALLIDAMRRFGSTSRVPSLWIYGDNDSYFPAATWRAMRAAYIAAGAPSEALAYGRFRDDSHRLLGTSESLPVFAPRLDAFLAGLRLPSAVTHPEYLPTIPPPPSGYAAIDDVEAVPHLPVAIRDVYRAFLKQPYPRVFVIGPGNALSKMHGGFDPLARILDRCRALNEPCKIYAVNGDVVWTRPSPVPPPSGFAGIGDVGAVPHLDEAGRAGYRQFLAMPRPRAFVLAPNGAWAYSNAGADPLPTILAECRTKTPDCRPYAVDGAVVWTGPKPGRSSP